VHANLHRPHFTRLLQTRPDLVITAAMLTVMLCEYKKAADGVQGAYQDLVNKCTGALPPGHYGAASFIPAICASGHAVEFCAVGMDGQVAFADVVGTHVMQMELTAPVFALSLLSYVGIWSATGKVFHSNQA
jgi:hypothetical protein